MDVSRQSTSRRTPRDGRLTLSPTRTMLLEHDGPAVLVRAPARLNLFLEVLRRRPDGVVYRTRRGRRAAETRPDARFRPGLSRRWLRDGGGVPRPECAGRAARRRRGATGGGGRGRGEFGPAALQPAPTGGGTTVSA